MNERVTSPSTLVDQIRPLLGKLSDPRRAPDPVNTVMIRHWCQALTDRNPVYLDATRAMQTVHGGIVAPPAMLDAWIIDPNPPGVVGEVLRRIDDAGYTSVVATNSEHEYDRYLRPGDHLTATTAVTEFSGEKQTALGRGHFFTNTTELRTDGGERVGRVRMRILKFMPGTARMSSGEAGAPGEPRPLRPRPGVSRDTRFFWDGVERGELRIQCCRGCGKLHHPPVVRCPECGGYEQGHVVSAGRGTVYSFAEPCHPKLPAFDYPYVVGLVELEEGVRLLTNIVDVDPELLRIGMPVDLVFRKVDAETTLPVFRPRCPEPRPTSLRLDEVEVGQELPLLPIPITSTLIVAGAIASRDFTPVHHDVEVARAQGSADIFMNILTTNGLCSRYVTDWTGPDAVLHKLSIRLGVPNYPGDTMTFSGQVTRKEETAAGGIVEIGLRGANRLGNHVTGTIVLELRNRS